MKTLSERLAWAIDYRKTDQSKLARAIGVKPQSIQAILAGKVQTSGRVVSMARALKVSPHWLADNIGPRLEAEKDLGEPVENIAQRAVDFTLAELKHPLSPLLRKALIDETVAHVRAALETGTLDSPAATPKSERPPKKRAL